MQNYATQVVRSAASVTNAYVAGTIIGKTGNQISKTENKNQLILFVDFTLGTLSYGQIKVEYATALTYDLAYDGQTANFTVGKIVRGATSGAEGTIISDTDSGATGTLVIAPHNSTPFVDNEVITDNNSTAGTAVVNGAMAYADSSLSARDWYQETLGSSAAGVITETTQVHRFTATGKYTIAIPMKYQYARVSVIGDTTQVDSSMRITAVVGTV